jgi:hypothetical protein
MNMVEVTQADRDAAAAYMKLIGDHRWSQQGILSGGCDNTSVVQAFAAHRLSAYAPDKVTVEVKEAAAMAMWREEAERAAPNVAKNRTSEAWLKETEETRQRWQGLATAAILAAFAVLKGDQIERKTMLLDPTVQIECDECEHFEEFGLTPLANSCYDERGVKSASQSNGWIWESDTTHFCSKECQEMHNAPVE